ncbi:MAG TPA: hypothetical protein VNB22_00525 [Pyrinomonadaceae bacterium]|jgi:hypothetical protein|nr:hypothetical protein [Pyrinomonadaceae bacterium]
MRKPKFAKVLSVICVLFLTACGIFAQFKSQEVSEEDGIPVLIKHLPDWENARNRATYTNNTNDLRKALGDRAVFELIDFAGGTEAVTAPYDAGKLLIVEYTSPQISIEADNQFKQKLAGQTQNPPVFYRRIGNYSAFVFDANDEITANALLDQIKYEKNVQWLGEDPNKQKKYEHYIATTMADVFLSTTIWILSGVGIAILTGVVIGFLFFRSRDRRRIAMTAFSDAGGMIRLNLDELTAQTSDRLLNE